MTFGSRRPMPLHLLLLSLAELRAADSFAARAYAALPIEQPYEFIERHAQGLPNPPLTRRPSLLRLNLKSPREVGECASRRTPPSPFA